MFKTVVLLGCVCVGVWGGGLPLVTPTVGKVWPKPQLEVTQDTYVTLRPGVFNFTVGQFSCDMLTKAISRYMDIMFPYKKLSQRPRYSKGKQFRGYLDRVHIHLFEACEELPYLNMDEHYEIKVDSPDSPGEGTIMAPTIWGVLRALETFSQLMVPDGDAYRINSTQLMDFPRFPHRGFMIDTSRHFLPLASIKDMLDLMSMNKFNVLHWHIVDSQSFPYDSAAYPGLSAMGAYLPSLVYSAEDIAEVVSYAIERGIRVLPEFDTPGHTASWGLSQPGLLTECYGDDGKPDGTTGPMDPSNEANYDFLKKLFTEVGQRFPDHYLHLGGDEVPFDCWKSNPNLTEFMKVNNISGNYPALEEYYITKLLALVADLPTKNGYMVWQEVFDNGVKLAEDTVVHIWKDGGNMDRVREELADVTNGGFQTLLSSCWYLNYVSYGIGWQKYYTCDPQDFNGTGAQKALIIGGEACMWGEYVDKTNIISRSWPAAAAVAERLWSSAESANSTAEATPRLEEHRCRLLGRGYSVEPLWPSYCPTDNDV